MRTRLLRPLLLLSIGSFLMALLPLPARGGGPVQASLDKRVQFLDLSSPGNPMPLPATPVEQVDCPPCGCVRFTLTVTADAFNPEDLTAFVFTDSLPPGLIFAGGVQSGSGITAAEGPPGTVVFSNVPDLSPGSSASVSYRACVSPGQPSGLLVNTADVQAQGASSGNPTNPASDTANVQVAAVQLALVGSAAADPVLCSPQQTSVDFQLRNTGEWPLSSTLPAATVDAQLSVVNQNPPPGTVVQLAPGESLNITLLLQALPGGPMGGFESCARMTVQGHPDRVHPAATDCDPVATEPSCLDVIDPGLVASCLSVDPQEAAPGDGVRMRFRVANTGNVPLDPVSVSCVADPEFMTARGIPADVGPLAPGEQVDVEVTGILTASALPGSSSCVSCEFTGHPVVLPLADTSCDVVDTGTCCVDALDCLSGNVNLANGMREEVLLVNGSAGDPDHVVTVGLGVPVVIELLASSAGPVEPGYILWVWRGSPMNPITLGRPEFPLGCLINPTPLFPGLSPQPFRCFRSTTFPDFACDGVITPPSRPLGPLRLEKPNGFVNPFTAIFQGMVRDNGTAASQGFSVTNVVILDVR